jgi:hypothetical protein
VFGAEAAAGGSLFGAAPAASVGADTGATFADSLTPATAGIAGGGGVEAGAFDATFGGSLSAADAASAGTTAMAGTQPGTTDLVSLNDVAQNATDPAAKLGGSVTAPTGLPDTTTAPNGLINQPTAPTDLSAAPPGTQTALAPGGSGTSGVSDSFGSPNTDPNFLAGKVSGEAAEFNPAQSSAGGSGVFGQLGSFIEKHPTLAFGALQAGGSLLSGVTSTLTPAQVAALNSQAAANDAATALSNQQRTNLAMPKSVASSQPVSGTPGPLVPQTAGFINQAPRLAQVTGTPA